MRRQHAAGTGGTSMMRRSFAPIVVLAFAFGSPKRMAAQTSMTPVGVTVGRSVATLTGPWKFHLGDDVRWANPEYDDSSWESVDLTAPPGAHDDDVGLSG